MLQYFISTDFMGYSRKMRIKVLLFNLISITSGLMLGRIIDSLLGSHPVFTIIGVIASFPLTAWLIKNKLIKHG